MNNQRRNFALFLGPILFLLTLYGLNLKGLEREGVVVLASTIWIAVWWIAEVIPLAATALLPIVLFPMFGVSDIKSVTAIYASPTIFLFLGGFIIAVAIEKWDLHRRIALNIISWVGSDLRMIVLGVMLAAGFMSMWISNTATSVMMTPIGIAVARQLASGLKDNVSLSKKMGKALMLGISYSCLMGGMATLVGSPTNAVMLGVVDELYGVQISFAKWLSFGLPISLGMLFLAWFYLVRFAFAIPAKGGSGIGKNEIQKQLTDLGKMSHEEKRVLMVFVSVALTWIFRTPLQKILPFLNDTIIALVGALVLFLIPSRSQKGTFLLDWKTAERIPWGILLLFAGGLALAAGFKDSGLASWIGNQLTLLEAIPYFILLLVLVFAINFLTEMTSNVATASMLMPILASLAFSINVHPYGLMVAATMAASCAFMLPVASPPNAVVFGSGYLSISGMIRAGFWMNVLSSLLVTLLVYFALPWVWGIDLGEFPQLLKE